MTERLRRAAAPRGAALSVGTGKEATRSVRVALEAAAAAAAEPGNDGHGVGLSRQGSAGSRASLERRGAGRPKAAGSHVSTDTAAGGEGRAKGAEDGDDTPAALCLEDLDALVPEFDAAYAARGFAGIATLLREHSDDAAKQCAGFFSLAKFMRGPDADLKARAGDAGAVEAVLAALNDFRHPINILVIVIHNAKML